MLETLLRTKLFVPPLRPNLVHRTLLIERLNQGLQLSRKLTLISAPAGFGKTTLVSDWVTAPRIREGTLFAGIAWLSLDEGDNDLKRFLTYLVAALQTLTTDEGEGAAPVIGERALTMLQSPQPATESILTTIINDIAAVPEKIIFVLDDYHVIDSMQVDEALTFLLEHSPPQLHLVIATRDDPNLPSARLRARGQLTELRAADLRFSSTEAAEFLNQVMGLNLAEEDVMALEARTEGWIAGLQLAAISMQGQQDSSSLIKSFTGSHRFVLDYLIEEVLEQQPASVQTFLLQTAVLDRLTGPLCDAVTGQEDGRATLEMLEHANLFIIPLDGERRWYRYHHLFADLLRQRLRQNEPEQIPALHSWASEWYEQNGLWSDATRQALAAKDFERLAKLAEMTWQMMDESFQSATWLDWVKAVPQAIIRSRPVLCVQYAWALNDNGELEEVAAWLQDAERWLVPKGDSGAQMEGAADEMVVVDEEQFQALPAIIAIVRANNAQYRGDASDTVKYAEQALDLLPEEDYFRRAQATAILGMTHWSSGELEAAHRAMIDWIESMETAGNIVFAIASAFALADIMVAQGHLQEAVGTYQHALRLAAEQDEHMQRIIAHHHLGLAMLHHEMGDQEGAARHLQKSSELGELSTLIDWPYRWCAARARLEVSRGDMDAALDLLDEAKRVYIKNPVPDIRPVEALKARIFIEQGRLAKAQDWARERGLAVDDELSYLGEFEHMTLARLLTAEYEREQADSSLLAVKGLLERLLQAAEEGKRMGSVIEILIMQALAHQAQGETSLAIVPLERALTLAEPEGYVQIFVDEGPPMARLLLEAQSRGTAAAYAQRLLAAFPSTGSEGADPTKAQAAHPDLFEPLSAREIEVLQLIAEGLTNQEIADRLYLSLNTVKVHTRNINGKLGVNSRTKAVVRARALGILPVP